MPVINRFKRQFHRIFCHGFWHHNFLFLPYNSMYATLTIWLTSLISFLVLNILADAIININNPWADLVSLVIIVPLSYLFANTLTNVFFYTRHPKMSLDQYLQFVSWNQIDKGIQIAWRHHHKIIVVLNPKLKSIDAIKNNLKLISQHSQNHTEIRTIKLFKIQKTHHHSHLKLIHVFARNDLQ